jgi:thiol-disulfide isomerase/thioredoxin
MALWLTFGIVILIVFLVLAHMVQGSPGKQSDAAAASSSPAPADVVQKVTSVPASVYDAIGQGSSNPLPKAITAPALTQDGKPRVVYIGAEYCPYCAAERWAMVIALSRFGTFAHLQASHSATQDVFPNTQTFSFHASSYTSQYLVFTPVEQYGNEPQGNAYAPLDSLTQDEKSLVATYDAAPYVPGSAAGSIPFIDIGGKYLISGSTYQPSLLQGKSLAGIANALSKPGDPISQGAVGAANAITAAICQLTSNQPSNVCSDSAIKNLQAKLASSQ